MAIVDRVDITLSNDKKKFPTGIFNVTFSEKSLFDETRLSLVASVISVTQS